jgi:hypothetical protein
LCARVHVRQSLGRFHFLRNSKMSSGIVYAFTIPQMTTLELDSPKKSVYAKISFIDTLFEEYP